jgi:hypothetical protein
MIKIFSKIPFSYIHINKINKLNLMGNNYSYFQTMLQQKNFNLNTFTITKKYFSSQEKEKEHIDINENKDTSLIPKIKKQKKRKLSLKTFRDKKDETIKEEINNIKKDEITNNEVKEKEKEKKENIKIKESKESFDKEKNKENFEEIKEEAKEKIKESKPSKKEIMELRKEQIKKELKSRPNLKEIYEIKSRKMGEPDVRKFIDFSKLKHSNLSTQIFDRESFLLDEKNIQLTPISPKLGPFIVN